MLLRTYEQATARIPDEVVGITAWKFTKGQVDGQSLQFSPSVAEFTQAAEKQWDQQRKSAIALPRGDEIPHEPLLAKVARLRREYAGFPVLAEGVTTVEFQERSRRKEWPAGSEFVAALGTVFGTPKAVSHEKETQA